MFNSLVAEYTRIVCLTRLLGQLLEDGKNLHMYMYIANVHVNPLSSSHSEDDRGSSLNVGTITTSCHLQAEPKRTYHAFQFIMCTCVHVYG